MSNKRDITILVVEDDQDTLKLLSTLSRRQGWQVQAVDTGAKAMAAIQDPDIALVIIDVMLPGISGLDACLQIKEKRPRLPVIILSARGTPLDIVTGLDSGADDYITKPFVTSELLARVRAALRAASAGATDVAPRKATQQTDDENLQEVSQVLSTISHELRSPVAAIKGFITTLLSNYRYWDDQQAEAFLEKVNESVDQLSRHIENVLEMGRLDKGLELYKRPTNLASLVQRVLYDLSFQTTCCELVNEVPESLPPVAIDPLKIERALRNLLENALKFSPHGGTVRVFAHKAENEIQVGVEDQGIGIPSEHLPHIFKRFYQAHPADVPQEGIGLGLYITKELIHSHKGKIWASSQPDKGTTFYFTLPLSGVPSVAEHVSPTTHPVVPRRNGTAHQAPGTNGLATILVVEDDPAMRQSLKMGLKAAGFEILDALGGSQAIELVEKEKPDLILLDLQLPDMDGLAVCERVRRFSNVPIIIVTGRKAESYRVRGLALGADDYLVKPFSNRELLARVRALLRRTQNSDRAEPPTRLQLNGLEIDPVRHEVKTPQGSVKLTPTEHKLLYHLGRNAGRTLTHEQLLTKVWGYESDHQTEYLWVNISRLRKKIEPDHNHPHYILTEPGVGYRFRAPDHQPR